MQFYHASAEIDLLNTALADKTIILRGTTDVVIVDTDYVKISETARGVQVAIELKKKVHKRDHKQAMLQLIAANCHSNAPVLVLLTDLRQAWGWNSKMLV